MYGRNQNRENDQRRQRQGPRQQDESVDLRYDLRFGAYDPNMGLHDYADYTGDGDRYSQRRDSAGAYRGGVPSMNQWGEADPYRKSSSGYGRTEWTPSPGESQRGRFYGKGPKGYRRSDERLREDVCERLADHGDVDASDIEVSVGEGIVTLSGNVDSRRTKRLVEEAIEDLSGLQDIRNELRFSTTDRGEL